MIALAHRIISPTWAITSHITMMEMKLKFWSFFSRQRFEHVKFFASISVIHKSWSCGLFLISGEIFDTHTRKLRLHQKRSAQKKFTVIDNHLVKDDILTLYRTWAISQFVKRISKLFVNSTIAPTHRELISIRNNYHGASMQSGETNSRIFHISRDWDETKHMHRNSLTPTFHHICKLVWRFDNWTQILHTGCTRVRRDLHIRATFVMFAHRSRAARLLIAIHKLIRARDNAQSTI